MSGAALVEELGEVSALMMRSVELRRPARQTESSRSGAKELPNFSRR